MVFVRSKVRAVNGAPKMLKQVNKGRNNAKAMALQVCIICGRVGLPTLYILFCIIIFAYGARG